MNAPTLSVLHRFIQDMHTLVHNAKHLFHLSIQLTTRPITTTDLFRRDNQRRDAIHRVPLNKSPNSTLDQISTELNHFGVGRLPYFRYEVPVDIALNVQGPKEPNLHTH